VGEEGLGEEEGLQRLQAGEEERLRLRLRLRVLLQQQPSRPQCL